MLQVLAQDQPGAPMGRLLRDADAQLFKSCDEVCVVLGAALRSAMCTTAASTCKGSCFALPAVVAPAVVCCPALLPRALLTPGLLRVHPPPLQDIGGCGQRGPVNHLLGSQPRVFTLQLGWESHGEAPEAIAATLAAVDETVRWV